ncbi:MAG: EamA family transporter [Lautropia sp.]
MNTTSLLLLIGSTVFGALCQLGLKSGSAISASSRQAGFVGTVIDQLGHPHTLLALCAQAIALLCWLLALRAVPLSVAYPFMGLTMVIVIAGSVVLFGEPLTLLRSAGMLLSVAGVVVIGMSYK